MSHRIRKFFPQLRDPEEAGDPRRSSEEPRVYLDSAATTLILEPVLHAMEEYYRGYRANIHRGVYRESEKASEAHEKARKEAARFIGASSPEEIIFTSGTTEAINLLARSLFLDSTGQSDGIQKGGITASLLEHHSNLLPWVEVSRRRGSPLSLIPLKDDGSLDLEHLERDIQETTALVAITALSNVTGELIDLQRIIKRARAVGALVLVDAAQAAARIPFDVRALDIDFLALSGHKCYGPSGTGLLYGKKELLAKLPPLRLGGGMVESVKFSHGIDLPQWKARQVPERHEGGTLNIPGNIGLGEAFGWLSATRSKEREEYEKQVYDYCKEELKKIDKVRILLPGERAAAGAISFTIDALHPHDAVSYLDALGYSLRGGLHCAEPLHSALGVPGSLRASFGIYTTEAEITGFISALRETIDFFT